VASRTLLLGTALVGPFYVALARRAAGADLGGLGLMLVASGLAGALSASVWGRLADRSSRRVMAAGGGLAAGLGAVVITWLSLGLPGGSSPLFFGAVIFVLGVAHAGVRIGRKTYLVDMAGTENRATYVAVSNTLIGLLLLAGGAVGLLAEAAGLLAAVGVLSALALAGAISSAAQAEVQ
jgi:MFS family permease